MYDVHDAIAARLNPCVGLASGLDRFERPFHSVVDDGPKFPSVDVENLWDKQARLEEDYFESSRKSVFDDLDTGIMPQTGAALNILNDSRDYSSYNTPRYGLSSGLSRTGEFEAPNIRHDPELLSPKPLLDRFESSFSAPRMRHSRFDDDGCNISDRDVEKTFREIRESENRMYRQYKEIEESKSIYRI